MRESVNERENKKRGRSKGARKLVEAGEKYDEAATVR